MKSKGLKLLSLLVTVNGYDSLSAAKFWSSTVVEVTSAVGSRWDLRPTYSEDRRGLAGSEVLGSYDDEKVTWINGEACNWTAPAVMTGHVSLNIAEAAVIMKTPRVLSLTFLRDPLSRVVSYANFVNMPFDEFVNSEWQHMATNLQTMMLNGVRNVKPLTSSYLIKSPVSGMCQFDPAEAIASARRQLVDIITVFGITERYVESMWLFKKTFGWDTEMVEGPLLSARKAFCLTAVDPEECGKHRYTVDDIDSDTRAAIRKAEACDYAVYETAIAAFDARIKAGDQEDLADFKSVIHTAGVGEERAR